MIIKYQHLEIDLPYEVINIKDINLIQMINEHHTLKIEALIKNEDIDKYVEKKTEGESIRVSIKEMVIYSGKIAKVTVIYKNSIAYLVLETVSFSHDLDIKRKRKSFINLSQTYESIILDVLSSYKKYEYRDNITSGQTIEDIIVQYEETDWEFLKRLAASFSDILLVDSSDESIRVSFGMETLSKETLFIEDYEETSNDLKHISSVNSKDKLNEKDFIKWQLSSREYFPVGSKSILDEREVYITKVEMKKVSEEILFFYEIKSLNGIITSKYDNQRLKGVTLEGIVQKVKKNQIQLSFCIDNSYEENENNKWFDYCRGVNNFYLMPVLGSKMNITFLAANEKDSIVTSAVRTAKESEKYYNKVSDPNSKSFSTAEGQELLISPEMIQISEDDSKSVKISLYQNGKVDISGKNIKLRSNKKSKIGTNEIFGSDTKDIVKPKSINISAKNCITITRSSGEDVNINEVIQLGEENNIRGVVKFGR